MFFSFLKQISTPVVKFSNIDNSLDEDWASRTSIDFTADLLARYPIQAVVKRSKIQQLSHLHTTHFAMHFKPFR